ncbi:MAG: preprotein translocase subunit SecG [Candidatus Sungiibacteriota bacterium]
MKTYLAVVQIVVSALLIGAILLQQRGTGLSATFGGEGNVYRTKRGLEKVIFIATIVLAIIFFATAIANILL